MADILDWQAEEAKKKQQKPTSDAASSGPFKVTTINGKKVILDKDGKPYELPSESPDAHQAHIDYQMPNLQLLRDLRLRHRWSRSRRLRNL